ncbi:MAG TPA: hypothetical protein VMF32_20330 [Xanthobacteraceae bacterium]|nr:hypothetical protein [Xanthobacteraceae bacterium]
MKRLLVAVALAGIITTPALATTVHHRAASSARQLYMYEPEVAPQLQSPPTRPLQPQTYGPSSQNFNNQAWPGGRPSRY